MHAANSDFLGGIDRSQLTVREEGATNALRASDLIVNRGIVEASALLVVVPDLNDSVPIADENYHLIEEKVKNKYEGMLDQ